MKILTPCEFKGIELYIYSIYAVCEAMHARKQQQHFVHLTSKPCSKFFFKGPF